MIRDSFWIRKRAGPWRPRLTRNEYESSDKTRVPMGASDVYSFGILCSAVHLRSANPFLHQLFLSTALTPATRAAWHWATPTGSDGRRSGQKSSERILAKVSDLKADKVDGFLQIMQRILQDDDLSSPESRSILERAVSHLCLRDPSTRSIADATAVMESIEHNESMQKPGNRMNPEPSMYEIGWSFNLRPESRLMSFSQDFILGKIDLTSVDDAQGWRDSNLRCLYSATRQFRRQCASKDYFEDLDSNIIANVANSLISIIRATTAETQPMAPLIGRESAMALFDLHMARLGSNITPKIVQAALTALAHAVKMESDHDLDPIARSVYLQYHQTMQPEIPAPISFPNIPEKYEDAVAQGGSRSISESPFYTNTTRFLPLSECKKSLRLLLARHSSSNAEETPQKSLVSSFFQMQSIYTARTHPLLTISLDNQGTSALHYAVRAGLHSMVEFLLVELELDVDMVDCLLNTPLHYAVWKDDAVMVECLIGRHGASPMKCNAFGRLPTHMLCNISPENAASAMNCMLKNSPFAWLMARNGFGRHRIEVDESSGTTTLLLQAIAFRRVDIVCLLLEVGHDIFAQGADAQEALQQAIRYQCAYIEIYEAVPAPTLAKVSPWTLLSCALEATPARRILWHGPAYTHELDVLFQFVVSHFFDGLAAWSPSAVYLQAVQINNLDILPTLRNWSEFLTLSGTAITDDVLRLRTECRRTISLRWDGQDEISWATMLEGDLDRYSVANSQTQSPVSFLSSSPSSVTGEGHSQVQQVPMENASSHRPRASNHYHERQKPTESTEPGDTQRQEIINYTWLLRKCDTLLQIGSRVLPSMLHNAIESRYFNSFGVYGEAWMRAYKFSTDSSYLDWSISCFRYGIRAVLVNSQLERVYTMNLGIVLASKHQISGSMPALEESIRLFENLTNTSLGDETEKINLNKNLSFSLGLRYMAVGFLGDLDEAVRISRENVNMVPKDSLDWFVVNYNLSQALLKRYESTGTIDDLEEAPDTGRKATMAKNSEQPLFLVQVGKVLLMRFYNRRIIADLDEAIRIMRQGLERMPLKLRSMKSHMACNFGWCLLLHYLETKSKDSLEEAIALAKYPLQRHPQTSLDSERVLCLWMLAMCHINMFVGTRMTTDLEAAISCFQNILDAPKAPYVLVIRSGMALMHIHRRKGHLQLAYASATRAVSILPTVVHWSLSTPEKLRRLIWEDIVGLASEAAAVALAASRGPVAALSLLEQGRGLVASSVTDIRVDIEQIRSRHPGVADDFILLRSTLDEPTTPGWVAASRRHEAAEQLSSLVQRIRRLPGFESFLLPPGEKEWQAAAQHGPIVVINVASTRSDAILIERNRIRAVLLPRLQSEDIKKHMRAGSRLWRPRVLEWLWDVISKPTLEALGHTGPPSDGVWPRIWWMSTGALSKFPLHAAGYHTATGTDTVLDRVMSSYSQSLQAIINGRSRQPRSNDSPPARERKALLVALRDSRLAFTVEEVQSIRPLCAAMGLTCTELASCRTAEVIRHLPTSYIFHFAGHGHSNPSDPSASYLQIENGTAEQLTVAKLLELNLGERRPFLAYLSACGTSEMHRHELLDESIHLISACQLAGFRHSIGTLWEVNDELCKDVAQITYKVIRDGAMTDESVCRGLHIAIRRMREVWREQLSSATVKRTTRTETPVEYDRVGPIPWVPYVHFGV